MSHSNDNAVRWERALLGSVLLSPESWETVRELHVDDFLLPDHKKIFAAMSRLSGTHMQADITALHNELGDSTAAAIVRDLTADGTIGTNAPHYVREVRNAGFERRFDRCREVFNQVKDDATRLEQIEKMKAELLAKGSTTSSTQNDWRALFHTREEIENAPPLRFALDGFLQEEGITLIGGLAGHGKTLCMLSMVRALLEQGRLFTRFQATRAANRVVYLIPEAGIGPFSARLRTFRLTEYLGDRLFVQTLSAKTPLTLTDPRLLTAAEGADIFLDTAIRFMQGDENDASEQRAFAESLFRLQAAGARTITGAHHSPKAFSKDNVMTLENVLRGSGDIGAMLCTAWGLKQIDPATNSIYIANVKPRDFQPCEPFIIKGRPCLDETGYFEMTHPPGFAGTLSEHRDVGRPELPEKDEKVAEARRLRAQGMSFRDIGSRLGVKVPTLHSWLNPKQ
jgi:hypothetical protein